MEQQKCCIKFNINMDYDVEGLKLAFEKLDQIIKKYIEEHEGKHDLQFNVNINI